MNRGLQHCTGGSDQNHPKGKKKVRRQNNALKITEKRREAKGKEKGKDIPN